MKGGQSIAVESSVLTKGVKVGGGGGGQSIAVESSMLTRDIMYHHHNVSSS